MGNVKVVTCPEVAMPEGIDVMTFVAGGITGCPDWQKGFIGYAKKYWKHPEDRLVLMNPRRENFDVTDPNMSAKQIEWEYKHLAIADRIIFWFPEETLCPITLFELGAALEKKRSVFVGCHPGYKRAFDVKHQLKLRRPEIEVVDSVEALAQQLGNHGILRI